MKSLNNAPPSIQIIFCENDFDIKKSVLENTGKEFYYIDLSDGDCYNSQTAQFSQYLENEKIKVGDLIGIHLDLNIGKINIFKNGFPINDERSAFDLKYRLKERNFYPLIILNKCKICIYQPNLLEYDEEYKKPQKLDK